MQARLKKIYDLIKEENRIGVWTVDLREQFVEWDAITRSIHEVPADFEPKLTEALDFYKDGTSRATITKLFNSAITEGKSFDTELQLITRKGRAIWVRAVGEPEFADGECVRVFGVFQDVNRRRLNEEKVLNYSILKAKSKEMEQFAYAASHDLREPLLTIRGYIEVIKEDFAAELPEEVSSYLRTINGAAKRMDDLLKGMLDYSRLSRIKQLQEVNLIAVLDDVIADLHAVVVGVDLHITYTDLPVVMGYPLELKVLLQNLIGNAIKYRRINVALRIKVTCKDLSNGWQITVTDNGIGIAKKDLKAIFKLFRRLHSARDYKGSGIGLANCKKIVELHGGEIWANSTLGEGSAFHFTIQTRDEKEHIQTTSQ